MKFNNFFLIKYIYLINASVMMFSCSSLKYNDNNYTPGTNLGYFEPMNLNTNQIVDDKKLLKIQKLQNINIVYFSLDRYNILPDFFYILDIHADFLRKNAVYRIRIEGHTDERGTPEYNIALGERRAYSVKTYLQSKGVLSDQMEIISYGKEKPVCFGHTEAAYSKNRRVILSY